MKTWAVISQGQCKFSCRVEKNIYQPEDTVRVIAEVDNSDCSMEIQKISVKLKREIKAVEYGKAVFRGKFDQKTTLETKEYPGLNKHEKVTLNIDLILDDIQKKNKVDLKKQSKNKDRPLTQEEEALSQLLAPSISAEILTCQYYLKIKPVFGMFEKLKGTPMIKLPLNLQASLLGEQLEQTPQVPDWAP